MRASFGLFTAFPLQWDPDEVAGGWAATSLVGLVLGIGWLMFHQSFVRVGGPFVAAGGVLLLHAALTGARPLRGVAAVAQAVTSPSEGEAGRALPDQQGAGTAVVTLLLLVMSSFLIRVDDAPAVLVLIPLVGRTAQALLLGQGDVEVGLPTPTPLARIAILVGCVAGMCVAPLMATLVRPVRVNPPVAGLELVALGVLALAVALAIGWAWRGWLRVRFGSLDANGWHSIGAVADLAALALVVARIS
ncbi:MAG: hypothetical protein ACR2HR_15900 [Euzebya sp.]